MKDMRGRKTKEGVRLWEFSPSVGRGRPITGNRLKVIRKGVGKRGGVGGGEPGRRQGLE